eukprot:18259-Chlamydomonas_euryale.AAC.3
MYAGCGVTRARQQARSRRPQSSFRAHSEVTDLRDHARLTERSLQAHSKLTPGLPKGRVRGAARRVRVGTKVGLGRWSSTEPLKLLSQPPNANVQLVRQSGDEDDCATISRALNKAV